ncbi:MAG: hypothetical protein CMJ46_08870 [Planctomyces sp.]|nr:hypothetical protein [Planctomyces sp.]
MKEITPSLLIVLMICVVLPGCHKAEGQHIEEHHHLIRLTSPVVQDVIRTQQYVCQIHSRRHIEVCALEGGYLQEIHVKEGQTVKEDELMFKIQPVLLQAKLDSELAEAKLAQLKVNNTQRLVEQNVVSDKELALAEAERDKARAKAELAKAELNFTNIKAPFAGIVDRQHHQQGSLIEEGDVLTTLSDNQVMWVYFNVPEARYLEYSEDLDKDELRIELVLANGNTFPQPGEIGAIEADFNNETGNIAFRADFENPKGPYRKKTQPNCKAYKIRHL